MVEQSLGKRKAPGLSPGVSENVIFGETVSVTLAETPSALGENVEKSAESVLTCWGLATCWRLVVGGAGSEELVSSTGSWLRS